MKPLFFASVFIFVVYTSVQAQQNESIFAPLPEISLVKSDDATKSHEPESIQLKQPESVSWEPNIKMDKNIYPSYIIGSSVIKFKGMGNHYLGEPRGLLGIDIKSTYKSAKFKLEIMASDITDPIDYEFTLPFNMKGEVFYVFPNINYRYQQLAGLKQSIPSNIVFKLFMDGTEVGKRIETVLLHSINDCPYLIRNADNSTINMNWMFTTYVNEKNPQINDITRDAINTGLVGQFSGNQSYVAKNIDQFYRQTIAIWTAMYNRNVKFSDAILIPSSTQDKQVTYQNTRFFSQTLKSEHSNCLDGSLAFASIFKHIGIDPLLVYKPGHVYLSLFTTADMDFKQLICLETTVIGNKNINESMIDTSELSYLMGLFPLEIAQKNKNGIINYLYALQKGTSEYRSDQRDILSYNIINITKLRKEYGTMPIPD